MHENRAECLFSLLKPYLRVFRGLSKTNLSGYVGFLGIRVKRDKWVSVRYAKELNSAKSSVILQRTDRHGILDQKRPDFQVSL